MFVSGEFVCVFAHLISVCARKVCVCLCTFHKCLYAKSVCVCAHFISVCARRVCLCMYTSVRS